jgi:hypothetical protein
MTEAQEANMADRPMTDKEARSAQTLQPGGEFFEIRVKGHLNSEWSDWLGGLQVRLLDSGEMILSGRLVDQAALMGVLNRLYSLNLTLLSLNEVDQTDRN